MHLDGHNQLDYLTGEADESPRQHFFYVSDDGDLTALRFDNWKFVFLEQRCAGHVAHLGRALHRAARPEDVQPADRPVRAGRHHVEHLLRLDASTTSCLIVPAQAYVAQMLQTLAEFPPRQEPASFSIEQVMAKLKEGAKSA